MPFLAFWPLKQLTGIHNNLSFRIERHLGAIHRARRRSFEVDALAVVATAMARTFKLVLTCLPVGCTTEMSATRVDDEESIGRSRHPDTVLLLPFCIHAEGVVGRWAD